MRPGPPYYVADAPIYPDSGHRPSRDRRVATVAEVHIAAVERVDDPCIQESAARAPAQIMVVSCGAAVVFCEVTVVSCEAMVVS